ncbi:hypothetical protein E0E05_02615 [Roseitalea porphyridii]|uniref:Polysaccharide chain length determinant N-terminal domain-containing protein n=2 Tax=Roseitalea porphyridii TaxID=1852022 RepID=A0A4P6UYL9_9HYPH|nr:hypothetical protein E0E05_02615 [Roseitalea porphyridii]
MGWPEDTRAVPMFDPASSGASSSLLMRASAREGAGSDDTGQDGRDGHRSARARRAARRPNPLLAALGRSDEDTADTRPDPPAEERPARDAQPSTDGENHARPSPPVSPPAPRADPAQRRDAPEPGAPLVDPIVMLSTIWRWRFAIALCTVLGGIIGVLVALSIPHRYTAYSEVLIDPREVQLVGRDLEREFLANEAALAIVDSRLSLVRSRPVLERVIEATNLDQDPEFNGASEGGIGLRDGLGVIMSLFGDETPVETSARTTLENLRDAIEIDRTTRTFVVTIGVEANAPRKAAMLANEVTRAFVEEQGSISSDKAREANTALTGRLDELQARVEQAERSIEEFRVENGLVSAQGRLLSEDDLAAASNQLAEARAATIRARSKAEEASGITIDDAIAGSVPIDLTTPSLTTFRAQHSALRQTAAQLEDQLGPRHPRLTAAQAATEAARQDIAAELGRIVQGAQSELRRAVQTEQELAAQVARAKAAKSDQSEAMVTLRDLQAEAEAARAIYSSALLRARETGEIGALGTVNAAILSPAEPPLTASSMSRKTIAIAFTIAGFLVGLGIATLAGLKNAVSLEAFNGARAAASEPPAGPRPGGSSPTRKASQDTTTMHPGYPYAPAPYQPQPSAQPTGYGQPHAPQHQPGNGWPPASQPFGQPASWPGQPQPSPYPQGGYPQAPAGHGAHPQPAYPPQMPMPPQAGHPGGWQQPQPEPAAMHGPYGAPGHVPQAAPGYQQAPWPQQPAPMAAPHWPAPTASYPPPGAQPHAPAPASDEMDELRRSIDDIREVVEELAARRGNVRRFA